jgi:hypothetical protein
MNSADASYSCTPDRKDIVACRFDKFVEFQMCHGLKGCRVVDHKVYCDTTLGAEGDMCRHPDNHACSEDGVSLLQCSTDHVWVKQMKCAPPGCTVSGNVLNCAPEK